MLPSWRFTAGAKKPGILDSSKGGREKEFFRPLASLKGDSSKVWRSFWTKLCLSLKNILKNDVIIVICKVFDLRVVFRWRQVSSYESKMMKNLKILKFSKIILNSFRMAGGP